MARILPDAPIGATTPEALRIYRLLKRLPDEGYTVWHRLSVWSEPGPDFWVLRHDSRALFLKVSVATAQDVQNARQPSMFESLFRRGTSDEPFGKTEQDALCQFVNCLPPVESTAAASLLKQVPAAVVFPNVPVSDLSSVAPSNLLPGILWLGNDYLKPDRFERWLEERLGVSLSSDVIALLRTAFTPEVVIPAQFTVRQPIERYTQARLTEHLLDYDQEWVLKTDLDLSTQARTAAGDFGLRLINGVAGSGKSLILVYRAHLLRQLYPEKEILVLTHNRALIRDLEYRYKQLGATGRPVTMKTFLGWCYANWPQDKEWIKPVGQRRRQGVISRAWRKHLADTSVTEQMLRDEIDWFKDRLLFGRQDYLEADRTGRGFALTPPMRERVFDAMVTYHRLLRAEGWVDWGDVPRQVWKFAQEGRIHLPLYDVVLLDEAQFFAPLWFEIIKRILKPQVGHLFLVADPTQGFLKRRQSWLSSGLEVRGRSHRLAKSYRTTLEILNFATLLYRTRLPEDDDDIVAPDLLDMPSGLVPQIIPLTSAQDEITRVVNEIQGLVKAGVPLEHILVIHADWRGAERLLVRLRQTCGLSAVADPKDTPKGDHIRVCTLNGATGLESPIVFLVGVHALYEQEQSLRLSEEESAELVRDNTRKLYMAITRAGQRLILTYVGEMPDALKRIGATPQNSG